MSLTPEWRTCRLRSNDFLLGTTLPEMLPAGDERLSYYAPWVGAGLGNALRRAVL